MEIFAYEVRYFEEISGKFENTRGFCAGDSRSEAIEKIETYYGKDDIMTIKLISLDHTDGVFDLGDFPSEDGKICINELFDLPVSAE